MTRRFALGLSGASGALYFDLLVRFLSGRDFPLDVVASRHGQEVFALERGHPLPDFLARLPGTRLFDPDDFHSPLASGSGIRNHEAMVVLPCSMKTVAHLAHGFADNLLERAADVFLKEKKRLIVVPRETPLSEIHLTNLLTLARAGAMILPAMPAFYHSPRDIAGLAGQVVGKVLDQLGLTHPFTPGWGEETNHESN